MDSTTATDTSSVGTNLYWNEYYSPEFPFINRMKTAGSWIAQGADSSAIPLTADGYPTGRPAGATNLYTLVALDPVTASGNNTYVMTWSGFANIYVEGIRIISNLPGKITFEFTRTDTNQTLISIDGLDPAHPLNNLSIVRSDQVDLYSQGKIFNPAFIDKVSKLDTLRFMDWNDTNTNKTVNWTDRTLPSNGTWSSSIKSGVPIEVEVALANEAKTNMWLNVPTQATDDYVRQLVNYVHNNLDPSLSLHLEYSNEVWNFGFQQAHYSADKADALWGNGQHFGPGWVTWYGYRAAQVASIANEVYGTDAGRLHNVLGTQTAYQGLENYIVDGVARANLGSVNQLFDDYAVTTYFGGTITGENDADRATILSWAKGGAAGVTAAFAALKNNAGLTTTDDGSLAWLRGVLTYQGAVAQRLGLNLVAYEGGIDLTQGLGAYGTDAGLVSTFLNTVRNDPRMADIYTQMTSDFSAAGGKLLNIYTDVGAGYGTLNSTYDSGSPAWDALVAAEAKTRIPVATTPVTTTPVTPVTLPVTTTPVTPVTPVTPPVTTTPVTPPVTTTPVTPVTPPVTTTPVTPPVTTTPVTPVTPPVTTTPVTPVTPPITTTPVTPPVTTTPVTPVPTPVSTGTTSQAAYSMADGEKMIAFVGTGKFTATGNNLDNTITAGNGGSALSGGAGADTLIGGSGVDLLDGGTGADSMVGGAGDDTYIVDNPGDTVVEKADAGTDEVRTTLAAYTLGDNVENLTYTGKGTFAGTGNALANTIIGGDGGATLSGGAGDDRLVGGAGNDLLDGGSGNDVMTGGAGDDTYIVDAAGDQVIEAAGGGTDTVRTTLASYTLPDRVEKLVYVGVGAFAGTGNNGGVWITGGVGNDTLTGGAGDDVLDGGAGNDVMKGGAGNDVYLVDSAGDQVVEVAGQGTDEVRTTLATYALGDNVEKLTYTGSGAFTGTGNALNNVLAAGTGVGRLNGGGGNDTLLGGAGDDYLDGGSGIDRMVGGAGNDTYLVDDLRDQVVEAAGGGTDTVLTTLGAYLIPDQVENLTYTGKGSLQAIGNGSDNAITGGSGINRLLGGAGNDTLTGGAANDVLDGGSGADRMVGGAGDDIYFVDNAGDRVVEEVGGGTDTVYSSVDYTLSANVEKLQLIGQAASAATGNDLDNTIIGNNAGDRLAGGAGKDTLIGGAGNDVLVGGPGADVLTGGGGADRFTFSLGDLSADPARTDTITDFSRTDGDRIDLSNHRAAGSGAFSFVGTGAFTKHAGELRLDTAGANQVVYGDLDGDGVADFSLNVSKGAGTLIAADFVL